MARRRGHRAGRLTDSLAEEDVPFDLIDAAEVMRRWPQWRLTDDVSGMWQARGGIADPYRGNAAHRRLAEERGATLRPRAGRRDPRGRWRVRGRCRRHDVRRRCAILATDAWTNDLLACFDRRLPLTVTKEQVTYFAAPDPSAFAPDRFPVWIWMDDPSFYGFPVYGEAGPKVAQDCGGQPTTPASRTFEPDAAISARVRAFLEQRLPGALGPEIHTKTCLYTLTPERDFVVDRLPDAPGVVVGLGAAHGFKYASVMGLGPRSSSRSTADKPSDGELGAFRIDRPMLLEATAARRRTPGGRIPRVPFLHRPQRVRRYGRPDR